MTKINSLLRRIFYKIIPLSLLVRIRYYLVCNHTFLDLKNPKTFNEKIQWNKVYNKNPLLITCADKIAVKKWVGDILGEDWVVPKFFSGTKLPPIEERNWELPFVIKANHGSGWNYYVKDRHDLKWDEIEKLTNSWLKDRSYGAFDGEWIYSRIKPQILVEKFIANKGEQAPVDYKFWVFNGKTKMVQVNTGRYVDLKESFYDLDWNKLELNTGKRNHIDFELQKPLNLRLMIESANKLGKYFDFVRVDFYEVNGKPYFGEMTFYPNAGYSWFKPNGTDKRLGDMWKITRKA